MDVDIQQHLVLEAPPSIFYIPEFISKDEETYLMNQVYSTSKSRWTQLSNRRLQNWGGIPHPKAMLAEDLPSWLQTYAEKISKLGVFDGKVANHVLVNEYEAGQGIMPHEDGPLYFPTVSTISLGSHTLLDFYRPILADTEEIGATPAEVQKGNTSTSLEDRYICSMLLQPRSLILVRDEMYTVNLHGIKECKSDIVTDRVVNIGKCDAVLMGDHLERSTRVSLTIRHVLKTVKTKLLFGKRR